MPEDQLVVIRVLQEREELPGAAGAGEAPAFGLNIVLLRAGYSWLPLQSERASPGQDDKAGLWVG